MTPSSVKTVVRVGREVIAGLAACHPYHVRARPAPRIGRAGRAGRLQGEGSGCDLPKIESRDVWISTRGLIRMIAEVGLCRLGKCSVSA